MTARISLSPEETRGHRPLPQLVVDRFRNTPLEGGETKYLVLLHSQVLRRWFQATSQFGHGRGHSLLVCKHRRSGH